MVVANTLCALTLDYKTPQQNRIELASRPVHSLDLVFDWVGGCPVALAQGVEGHVLDFVHRFPVFLQFQNSVGSLEKKIEQIFIWDA